MKGNLGKLFLLILAFIMMCAGIGALAEGKETTDGVKASNADYEYTIWYDYVEIDSYIGSATEVVIPGTIDGYPVRIIDIGAFSYCRDITRVTIPDGVQEICTGAFEYCTGLMSIVIPNSVTTLAGNAFRECTALVSVTLPNRITSIENNLFKNCIALKNVTIPSSVTTINSSAFYGCTGLTGVDIPSGVRKIQSGAFSGCSNLASVTLPDSLQQIDYSAFSNCTSLTAVSIPGSVTAIGDSAFYGCTALTSMDIPSSVTALPTSMFYNCSALKRVNIPGSVTTIGDYAFYGCTALTDVNIPSRVTAIGRSVFQKCTSLASITLPNGITSIGAYAFYNCNALSSVNIPGTVRSIGYGAFYDTALTSVTIPDSVTTLEGAVFYNCRNLTSATLSNNITAIADSTFYNCGSLGSVTIPNRVTSIGGHAFYKCTALTNVSIPGSVASIGDYAFGNCSGLTGITLNNGLTSIGQNAFYSCGALTSITLPNSVTSIGERAFMSCSSLTGVNIPNGVTSISKYTFAYSPIQSITIPNSVTRLDDSAFAYCRSLTSLNIPSSVTSIGEYAFSCCSSLRTITIPNSVTTINMGTFIGCMNLTNVSVPSSVTSLGKLAFGESGVKRITFTGNAPAFGENCFIGLEADAYYNPEKSGWTTDVRQNYGGMITWKTLQALTRPVMGLSHVISSLELKLTWEEVSGADGYELWRSDRHDGTYTKIGETTALELTDNPCLFGKINYYKVRAYRGTGDAREYSDFSIYRTCFGLATPGIRSLEMTESGVKVTAATVANATGYYIYRCETKNGLYDRLGTTTLANGVNTYVDTTAVQGTTYYYKCRAYYVSPTGVTYVGPFSVGKNITANYVQLDRPAMGLSYVISSLELKLTWERVPNADGYELWRSDAATGTYSKVGETTTALEFTDEHCLFGKINYYKVRAYKLVNGQRAYSDFSVYRTCFGLATPGIQKLESKSNGIKVTAATVMNATGYYIYRCDTPNGLYDRLGTTTLSGGVNSYLDTTAQPGGTYYYKCRAYYVSPTGVTYVGPFSVAKVCVKACEDVYVPEVPAIVGEFEFTEIALPQEEVFIELIPME